MTASPNIQTERARFDPEDSANALLKALGSQSTQRELENFNRVYQEKKLQEQSAKFDWYVDQFQKDHADGAVSQAQVKGRFPETVPIISARIAEAIGQSQGKKQFQAVIDEIANNDALRLDTNARAAFIAKKRAEITGAVGEGNDFYGAGVVQGIDKLMAQHELNWQTETAAYHQKVQGEQLSSEVVDAFNSGKPQALLDIDAKYQASSSLSPIERNKIVVSSAIDLAFTNDDTEILKSIPQRFLNVDSKAALVAAHVQLTERRMSDFRKARELVVTQRQEKYRSAQLEMLQAFQEGRRIDPAAYRDDPEAYQYALKMREAGRLDESTSAANAQGFRNLILTHATVGDMGTEKALSEQILDSPNLNPKEKQKLIEELPKLIEGRALMSDEAVRQPMNDVLGPALRALEDSPNAAVQQLIYGKNLRGDVLRGYDLEIRRSFQAEFEETGRWPTGHRKLELVDRAVDKASKRLQELTSISSLRQGGAGARVVAVATPAGSPGAIRAPSTGGPPALPKGVTLLK